MFTRYLNWLVPTKKVSEDSKPFRFFVCMTVLSALLAVLSRLEWPSFSFIVILGTILGFYISYHRRNRKNVLLKIILSFLMIYAFFDFMKNLRGNPYEPRLPLAALLLWLQTLHSFDLPSRRDLNYSLIVAVVLIGVAGVLTIDSGILIYYVLFLISGLAALIYNTLSRQNLHAKVKKELAFPFIIKHTAYAALGLILVTSFFFLFIPRYEGITMRPLPRSWEINLPSLTKGKIHNPGQEGADSLKGAPSKKLLWNADSYFGFNNYLHLNFRGQLSNLEVMKVKTTQPTYLRGLSFDKYDGTGWSISHEEEEDLSEVKNAIPPLRVEPDYDTSIHFMEAEQVTQIIHVRREMPNIIFSPYRGYLLYFPSSNIYVDMNMGLRSPYPLEKGMVYSVVALQRAMTPKMIRDFEEKHKEYMKSGDREFYTYIPNNRRLRYRTKIITSMYTGLPENMPPRVAEFTKQILRERGHENSSPLVKAMDIELYLKGAYPYDLDIPPFPDNHDSVDYFLFEKKRGYCEHFASAMTVMLRTQGIPARLVTGYLPGEYNPLSGFYSVKMNHAHAWVEMYIPDYGWYSIDPTPGFAGPATYQASQSPWMFMRILSYIQQKLPLEDFFTISPAVAMAFPAIFLAFIVVFAVISYLSAKKKGKVKEKNIFQWIFARVKETGKKLRRTFTEYTNPDSESIYFSLYRKMLDEFSRRGIKKKVSHTPREFLSKSVPESLITNAGVIVSSFEVSRYSPNDPGDDEKEKLLDAWENFKEDMKRYKN